MAPIKAEKELAKFIEEGYESTRDHNGKQAIVVPSSYGDVIVGATSLSHISLDHIDEGGRSNVVVRAIIDSIKNPLGPPTKTVYDDFGRPSHKRVGASATLVVNPETGELVTGWDTKQSDVAQVLPGKGKKGRRRKR